MSRVNGNKYVIDMRSLEGHGYAYKVGEVPGMIDYPGPKILTQLDKYEELISKDPTRYASSVLSDISSELQALDQKRKMIHKVTDDAIKYHKFQKDQYRNIVGEEIPFHGKYWQWQGSSIDEFFQVGSSPEKIRYFRLQDVDAVEAKLQNLAGRIKSLQSNNTQNIKHKSPTSFDVTLRTPIQLKHPSRFEPVTRYSNRGSDDIVRGIGEAAINNYTMQYLTETLESKPV